MGTTGGYCEVKGVSLGPSVHSRIPGYLAFSPLATSGVRFTYYRRGSDFCGRISPRGLSNPSLSAARPSESRHPCLPPTHPDKTGRQLSRLLDSLLNILCLGSLLTVVQFMALAVDTGDYRTRRRGHTHSTEYLGKTHRISHLANRSPWRAFQIVTMPN